MSTDHGIGCVTCSEGRDEKVYETYGNCCDVEALAGVIAAAPSIVVAARVLKTALGDRGGADLRIHMGELVYNASMLPWMIEHEGHQLRPIDEYGRWHDQCHGWVKCAGCKVPRHCVLADQHDGECSPEPR